MNDKFYDEKLSAEDKLIKAKIQLMSKSPFYSYLVMHMKFQRNDRIQTIGVDPDGNVFWNKKWIEGLTEPELVSTICHESTHVVLRHPERMKTKEKNLFNISVDIVTNNMLIQNGFTDLPKGGIIPRNDKFFSSILGISIEDISKKTAEEIYDELVKAKEVKQKPKGKKKEDGDEDGEGEGDYEFDEHIPDVQKENKDAKDMKDLEGDKSDPQESESSDSENKEVEISKNEDLDEKWGRILSQATTIAKMAGKDTLGMDRYVDKLLNPKRSWKNILYREVTHEMNVDCDWSRPSRRSEELGIYLPSQKKENINLAVAIDSSGSIDNKTLEAFLSHTRDVIASFSNISLTVLVCDCKVQSVHEFSHANINDVKKIKLKGHGGTSYFPVFDHLAKNKPDVRLVIYLTDGEVGEKVKMNKYRGRVLWVLTKDGTMNYIKGTGNIIKMEE